jgi:hypothetical protein
VVVPEMVGAVVDCKVVNWVTWVDGRASERPVEVLSPGGMEEYLFYRGADRVVPLNGSEVVAEREARAKAADNKVVVGTVVGLDFVSKID